MQGHLILGDYIFDLICDVSTTPKNLKAYWKSVNRGNISINLLLSNLKLESDIHIPSEFDIALTEIELTYDFSTKKFTFLCVADDYGEIYIEKDASNTLLYVGLDATISSSDIPVLGSKVGNLVALDNMGMLLTTHDCAHVIIPIGQGSSASTIPFSSLKSGIYFTGDLHMMSEKQLLCCMVYQLSSGHSHTQDILADAASSGTGTSHPSYFNIQKQLGPLYVSQLGFAYSAGILSILFDVSLKTGGLTISLEGLSLGSSLKSFSPEFSLEGLGINFQNPPLEIGASFEKVPPVAPVVYEFNGSAVIKTENLNVSAIGSYADDAGDPSMFIFAQLNEILGGPPAFYVTGLLGGFGYNRSIRIPTQDQISDFPFVAGFSNPAALGGSNPTPQQVLSQIETGNNPWVTTEIGKNWLAAGVNFTSFDLVYSTAVLIVDFANELSIDVVGISKANFPQNGDKKYAYIELGLEAEFKPAEGSFCISGMLTSKSFVIDPSCHLTGGFAFYVWFGNNPHAGDFVITVGGYNELFQAPAYYPQEPRLGFNWQVCSDVTIKGGAYFALTPSCIMAGGSLEVLFHDGNLNAWLTAYADFMIQWKPFYYTAEIGVSVGASYRLDLLFTHVTLEVDLGASVQIWGPETGGKAHVHWTIISFTVGFGASQNSADDTLSWSDFETLLPKSEDYCKIHIEKGLLKEEKVSSGQQSAEIAEVDGSDDSVKWWIVRPRSFTFSTNSFVPASELVLTTGTDQHTGKNTTVTFATSSHNLDIRPIGKSGLTSSHILTLKKIKTSGDEIIDLSTASWDLTKKQSNVAKGIWGSPIASGDTPSLDSDSTLSNRLVGFNAVIPAPTLGAGPGFITKANLSTVPLSPEGVLSISTAAVPSQSAPTQSANTVQTIESTIETTSTVRGDVVSILNTIGYSTIENNTLTNYTAALPDLYSKEPMLS